MSLGFALLDCLDIEHYTAGKSCTRSGILGRYGDQTIGIEMISQVNRGVQVTEYFLHGTEIGVQLDKRCPPAF